MVDVPYTEDTRFNTVRLFEKQIFQLNNSTSATENPNNHPGSKILVYEAPFPSFGMLVCNRATSTLTIHAKFYGTYNPGAPESTIGDASGDWHGIKSSFANPEATTGADEFDAGRDNQIHMTNEGRISRKYVKYAAVVRVTSVSDVEVHVTAAGFTG